MPRRPRIHWPYIGEQFDGMPLLAFSVMPGRRYLGVALTGMTLNPAVGRAEYRVLECLLVDQHHYVMQRAVEFFTGSDALVRAIETYYRRLGYGRKADETAELTTTLRRGVRDARTITSDMERWLDNLRYWTTVPPGDDPDGSITASLDTPEQALNRAMNAAEARDWVRALGRTVDLLEDRILTGDNVYTGEPEQPTAGELEDWERELLYGEGEEDVPTPRRDAFRYEAPVELPPYPVLDDSGRCNMPTCRMCWPNGMPQVAEPELAVCNNPLCACQNMA